MKSTSSSNAQLLARPVERPDLRVGRRLVGIQVRSVDDAKQILQPELQTVLRVVSGTLDVEEQVTRAGFGEGKQTAVRHQRTVVRSFGTDQFVSDPPSVLARDLQASLQPRTLERIRVPSTDFGELAEGGEAPSGVDVDCL